MSPLLISAFLLSVSFSSALSDAPHPNPQCKAPVFANATSGMKDFPFADSSVKNLHPILQYEVQPDGLVRNVRLVQSTGSKRFDATLIKVIGAWRFKRQDCPSNMSVGITLTLR